jgi:hypothetical protein
VAVKLESQVLSLPLFRLPGWLPTTEREGDSRRLNLSSEVTSVVERRWKERFHLERQSMSQYIMLMGLEDIDDVGFDKPNVKVKVYMV